MRQVQSPAEILAEDFQLSGKNVVDVGCGTGDLARWLTGQGALVVGLDLPEMLAKAESFPRAGAETYLAGSGESLPLADGWADLVLYAASLHHLPAGRLDEALNECQRVLKPDGRAVFIEPVYRRDSYGEITRLVEDESEILKRAYRAIRRAAASALAMVKEDFFFMVRSFADYCKLIETFVFDESRRPGIIAQARLITERRSAAAGVSFEDFRFRSICRLNILRIRSVPGRGHASSRNQGG